MFGSAPHFLRMWGNDPRHSLLAIEPDYDIFATLKTFYEPLSMQVRHLNERRQMNEKDCVMGN